METRLPSSYSFIINPGDTEFSKLPSLENSGYILYNF